MPSKKKGKPKIEKKLLGKISDFLGKEAHDNNFRYFRGVSTLPFTNHFITILIAKIDPVGFGYQIRA